MIAGVLGSSLDSGQIKKIAGCPDSLNLGGGSHKGNWDSILLARLSLKFISVGRRPMRGGEGSLLFGKSKKTSGGIASN
jgi:hypothetical protein